MLFFPTFLISAIAGPSLSFPLREPAVFDLSLDLTASGGGGLVSYLTSASTAHDNLDFSSSRLRNLRVYLKALRYLVSLRFFSFIDKRVKMCALFLIVLV